MRARWNCLAMGTLGLLLAAATTVGAQPPLDYNYALAYQHFQMSRYSYRTLYSSSRRFEVASGGEYLKLSLECGRLVPVRRIELQVVLK
jgi:hypothetical protein